MKTGKSTWRRLFSFLSTFLIPAENSLELFFTERLEAIVGEEEVIFNEGKWHKVYRYGIDALIQTPRDAIRLTNAFNTTYRALRRNANCVDLIAIEALRIYFNDIYKEIRSNPSRFTTRQTLQQDQDQDYSALWEDLDEPKQDCARTLLASLFPRTSDGAMDIRTTFSENKDTLRKRKRVCHPDIFPYYFRQTVPEGELTVEEVEAILEYTDDPGEFAAELHKLSEQEGGGTRSRANNFLETFEERTSEIQHRTEVIQALFEIGDHLISVDPSRNTFDRGNRGLLIRILWDLLDEEDPENRHPILEEAMSEGSSPYLSVYVIGLLLQQHGEHGGNEKPESQRLLERGEIDELKPVALNKIEEQAEDGSLSDSPHLDAILFRWDEWDSPSEPQEWVDEVTQTDEDLIELVGAFLREGRYSSAADSGKLEFIDPEWLEPFLDIDTVKNEFDSIDVDKLDEDQKHVVDRFNEAMEIRSQGNDPSVFEIWSRRARGR